MLCHVNMFHHGDKRLPKVSNYFIIILYQVNIQHHIYVYVASREYMVCLIDMVLITWIMYCVNMHGINRYVVSHWMALFNQLVSKLIQSCVFSCISWNETKNNLTLLMTIVIKKNIKFVFVSILYEWYREFTTKLDMSISVKCIKFY